MHPTFFDLTFFGKGFDRVKFAHLITITLGLCAPGLPVFAVVPEISVVESIANRNVTKARNIAKAELLLVEPLLLAQTECQRALTLESFETDTYYAHICEDGNGDLFYYGVNKLDGSLINLYGITFTDNGYYMATSYDEAGNEYIYMLGESLEVYENGEQIWFELTY